MPKSPFLRKNKPKKNISADSRRKQKFAIWDYYKKLNERAKSSTKNPPKTS